uniref:Uncharacterized protein n=1 Tax=uncultured bacterium BLR18 TaxID=506518 RepID=C0INL4_9BACT|nr:hypothetical protein AKSOIL_0285 [uncultured bacterium BLR18]
MTFNGAAKRARWHCRGNTTRFTAADSSSGKRGDMVRRLQRRFVQQTAFQGCLQRRQRAAGTVLEAHLHDIALFHLDWAVQRQIHVVVQPVDGGVALADHGQDVFRHEAHGVDAAAAGRHELAFPAVQRIVRLGEVDHGVHGRLGHFHGARIDRLGFMELHDRGIKPLEIILLRNRLRRHDGGFRQEHRQRSAEARQVAAFERFDDFHLLFPQHADVDHFADHDVDRFRRQVFKGIGMDDLDLVAVRIHGEEFARFLDHVGIEFDTIDLVRLGRGKAGHDPRAATEFQHLHARLDRVINRGLEAVHAVLVHQHIVMVVDRNELSQVAALDFTFVQHGFPFQRNTAIVHAP